VPAPMLREHRLRRGWTQAQLAGRAGYSERVIRKAEAGEPVRLHTLQVLAEALATVDYPVSCADLRGEPMAVVQAYYRIRRQYSFDFAPHCGHLLSSDYVMTVHADPGVVPYAGPWHGQAGLNALYQRIKQFFKPLGETVRFSIASDRVLAIREGLAQPLCDITGRPFDPLPPPMPSRILQEWTVRDGRIVSDDMYMETYAYQRALYLNAANASLPTAEPPSGGGGAR
jgi:transcriptional regulator with XRE-family HTH domain